MAEITVTWQCPVCSTVSEAALESHGRELEEATVFCEECAEMFPIEDVTVAVVYREGQPLGR